MCRSSSKRENSSSSPGPSGAGKSTLLRLLLRQELATEGSVKVAGRDLAKLTPSQAQSYRRAVGFVFQDFKLIPSKTVLDNVGLVPRVLGATSVQQQRRTFQVLKWLGLQHRMNAYPLELSPEASSNASRSRGRWSTSRRSSWPMNPPATSIRISRSKS